MYVNPNILKTKLRFSGVSGCISRERFQPVFQQILRNKLTLVIAGPGYGKSTIVSQAVAQLGRDVLWYRLDPSDQDFDTFVSYLIAGLASQYTDFGRTIVDDINEALGLGRRPEEVLTILLRHMENLPQQDYLIVLDDYHLVQDSGVINYAVEFFLKNIPHQIHLILISRSDPKLKISQLKAGRAVLELDKNDLCFTVSEVAALFNEIFQLPLSETGIRDLQQKTVGWVAALILFFHGLRGKSQAEIEDALGRMKGSHKNIAGYLEENVYALLPDETKHFLLKTSLLTRMNVNFCDRLIKNENSSAILSNIEQQHLFTFSLDEDRQWYCYHHLFQTFLQKKLRSGYSNEQIRELHTEIAHLWIEIGEKEEALGHYLAGEQIEQACRLLSETAAQLIYKGRLSTIQAYIQHAPGNYRASEPWLLFLQGVADALSGKALDAILFFEKACRLFEQKGLLKGTIWCLQYLAVINFIDGDFKKAGAVFEKLIQNKNSAPEENLNNYLHLIQLSCHLGLMDKADQYARELAIIINDIKDDGLQAVSRAYFDLCLSWRHIFAGEFKQAGIYQDRALGPLEKYGFQSLITLHYTLASYLHYSQGNYDKSLVSARQGLTLMRTGGIQDYFPFGWLLIHEASNLFELGKIPEAIEKADAALSFFRKAGLRWGTGWSHLVLHKIFSYTGDTLAAHMHFESCSTILADLTIPEMQGELKITAAARALTEKRFLDAENFISAAEQELRPFTNRYTTLLLVSIRLYQAQGQNHQALQAARRVLEICRKYQHNLLTIFAKKWNQVILGDPVWIIPLLMEMRDCDSQSPDMQFLIHQLKDMSAGLIPNQPVGVNDPVKENQGGIELLTSATALPGLHIFCFGNFKLFRGDKEITIQCWKSKNALNLFKYFVTRQNRGYLHREALAELLWPDQNPSITTNRLHVTISALRRVLEPELVKGMDSAYILSQNHFYRMDLGPGGSVDTVQFEEALKLAEKSRNDPQAALPHYLKAETLYQGEFLAEDPYLEWCNPLRENYREKYLNLMTRLMTHFEKEGAYDQSVEYANKYLAVDPYAEPIYQALMRYYSLIGNRVMVNRTFARCKEQITTALDCPLSRATEALFKSLRGSGS